MMKIMKMYFLLPVTFSTGSEMIACNDEVCLLVMFKSYVCESC